MNGQRKLNSVAKFRIYGVLFVVTIMLTLTIGYLHIRYINSNEKKRYLNIEKIVINSLKETPMNISKITKTKENDDFELVVSSKDGILFQTIPITDFATLDQLYSKTVLSSKLIHTITSENEEIHLWLGVYKQVPQKIFNQFFFVILVGILISGIFFFFALETLYIKMMNPLKQMKKFLMKLVDYRFKEIENLDVDSDNEFEALNLEIKKFAESLQHIGDEIGNNYMNIELKLKEEEVLNKYKVRLVSGLVHDLKTPLNITMLRLEEQKHNIANYYQIIKSQSDTIKNINEILKVLNIEKVEITRNQRIDLELVIKKIISQSMLIVQKKKLRVDIEIDENCILEGNQQEINQIFHNIISNALNYTDECGLVKVRMMRSKENVKLYVYNECKRVNDINFRRVFEVFYHSDSQYSSGLGMYIIKQLVEDYHGECSFTKKDKGCQFYAKLPLNWRS